MLQVPEWRGQTVINHSPLLFLFICSSYWYPVRACSWKLHFPGNQWVYTSFHKVVGCLSLLFSEIVLNSHGYLTLLCHLEGPFAFFPKSNIRLFTLCVVWLIFQNLSFLHRQMYLVFSFIALGFLGWVRKCFLLPDFTYCLQDCLWEFYYFIFYI